MAGWLPLSHHCGLHANTWKKIVLLSSAVSRLEVGCVFLITWTYPKITGQPVEPRQQPEGEQQACGRGSVRMRH